VLSVIVTPNAKARINLYVRPIEFQLSDAIDEPRAQN
jgi:hypothetical protein